MVKGGGGSFFIYFESAGRQRAAGAVRLLLLQQQRVVCGRSAKLNRLNSIDSGCLQEGGSSSSQTFLSRCDGQNN